MGPKEQEIMAFLHERVFDPVLTSPHAPDWMNEAIQRTITRMSDMTARAMIDYYWKVVYGTEAGDRMAEQMQALGFTRFEDIKAEFRARFNEQWLSA